jgi:hypothetical protein
VVAALGAAQAPGVPSPPTAREQVRRTIVLVVDDLGLSVEGITNIRRALHGFVDTRLLPSDLVAIVRTGEAKGLLQPLVTHRLALFPRTCSRSGNSHRAHSPARGKGWSLVSSFLSPTEGQGGGPRC